MYVCVHLWTRQTVFPFFSASFCSLPCTTPSLSFPPSFPSHLTFPLFFQPVAPVGYLGSRCRAAVWPLRRAVNKNTFPLLTHSQSSLYCLHSRVTLIPGHESNAYSSAENYIQRNKRLYPPSNQIISHLPFNNADEPHHNSYLRSFRMDAKWDKANQLYAD